MYAGGVSCRGDIPEDRVTKPEVPELYDLDKDFGFKKGFSFLETSEESQGQETPKKVQTPHSHHSLHGQRSWHIRGR